MEAIKGATKWISGFLIDYGGIVAFILIMGALVGAFVGVFRSFQQVLVEFLPFYMVTVAGAAALLVALISSLPSDSMSWIKEASPEFKRLVIVLMLVAVVILVLSIVLCATCSTPRPYERFVDGSGSPQLARLQADVAEAEEAVCKYITRADQFISGDVGPAGKKDPSLVTAAEEKARAGVNMVLCSDGGAADVAAPGTTPDMGDLENRIARLESTLSGFTGVVFKHSYDETVPCKEGFAMVAAAPTASELEQRLAAVRQTIADQQTQYLGPIDQKTKDLQSGKVSDCDKRRGAKLSAAGGPKAPAAPSSK
jgi:hypothetical protein